MFWVRGSRDSMIKMLLIDKVWKNKNVLEWLQRLHSQFAWSVEYNCQRRSCEMKCLVSVKLIILKIYDTLPLAS